MAGDSVSFKANTNGLIVVFDKNESFDSICEQISRRLESGGFFFQTRYLAVSYKGRKLTSDEEGAISRLMADKTGARTVLFEIDKDFERELRRSDRVVPADRGIPAERGIPADRSMPADYSGPAERNVIASNPKSHGIDSHELRQATANEGVLGAATNIVKNISAPFRRRYTPMDLDECITKYYRGTLRSGKLISFDGNVVVIGDINPGAEVEATGNIIVLGNVRGVVHAGAGGNKNASVIALNFAPTQLRVADVITRKADRRGDAKSGHSPEIAYLKGDAIIIESLAPSR